MSEAQQEDRFSLALSDLERLIEVRGDLSKTQARKLGVSYCLTQRIKTLRTPQMGTPYSMTIDALQRLTNLRKRSTDLIIRDRYFDENLELLVEGMVTKRADPQHGPPDHPIVPDDSLREQFIIEALEELLTIRRILVISFDPTGEAIKQLDGVIGLKMLDLHELSENWVSSDRGVLMRRVELCESLEAIYNHKNTGINEELLWLIEQIRLPLRPVGPAQDDVCSLRTLSAEEDSTEEGSALQERYRESEAIVGNLEQEVTALTAANEELDAFVESMNKQLRCATLSNVRLYRENTKLKGELATLENTVMEAKCAGLKRGFQGTIRKLCDEIKVLKSALADKDVAVDRDRGVYDRSFQSEALQAQESLAEAEEDLADLEKACGKLKSEKAALEDTLAEALRDRSMMTAKVEELDRGKANLEILLAEAVRRRCMLTDENTKLVSENSRFANSLGDVKDDYAALAADRDKQVDELQYALGIMSDWHDQKDELWRQNKTLKEEKAGLEEQLTDANQSLSQAMSTITATNMHLLTADNLRLEKELKTANDILQEISTSLRPRSSSISTVRQPSTFRRSPDTATDDLIDPNEDHSLRSGFPVDPYVMGEAESDVTSTILTPGSSVNLDESWDLSVNGL